MKHATQTTWKNDLHFESTIDKQSVHFDATALPGNHLEGVSPKKVILSGLAGCTGMDVAAILKNKFKIPFSDFSLDVEGELTESHPKYYHKIHLTYNINVAEADRDKVREAVNLSTEKYCGVHAMLAKAADITKEIQFV